MHPKTFFDFLRSLPHQSEPDLAVFEHSLQLIVDYLSTSTFATLEESTDIYLLYLRCYIFYADLLLSLGGTFDKEHRLRLLGEARQLYLQFYQALFEFKLLSSPVWNQISTAKTISISREQRIECDRLAVTQQQNNLLLCDLHSQSHESDGEFVVERELLTSLLVTEYRISVPKFNSILMELNLLQEPNSKNIQTSAKQLPFEGKPFTILSNRQQEKHRVFGPSHRLPTMTIDEYLVLERKRGGILDSQHQKQETVNIQEDVQMYDDFEIHKIRAFDAFKDDNRRGSGNRMNYS